MCDRNSKTPTISRKFDLIGVKSVGEIAVAAAHMREMVGPTAPQRDFNMLGATHYLTTKITIKIV